MLPTLIYTHLDHHRSRHPDPTGPGRESRHRNTRQFVRPLAPAAAGWHGRDLLWRREPLCGAVPADILYAWADPGGGRGAGGCCVVSLLLVTNGGMCADELQFDSVLGDGEVVQACFGGGEGSEG